MNILKANFINRIICFFSVSMLLFSACSKKYTIENLPKTQLHFGDGGGFMGKESDYIMLENGQVFYKAAFDKSYQEVGKIKRKMAKDYFKQIAAYQGFTINKPHNQYSFIRLQKDTTQFNYIFSGAMKPDSLTTSLLKLHEQMLKAIPKTETKERKMEMQ